MTTCTYSSDTNGQMTRPPRGYRELAHRESDGISVRLWWSSIDDEIFVHVTNERDGVDFVLNPPKRDALFAFHHPYAAAGHALKARRIAG